MQPADTSAQPNDPIPTATEKELKEAPGVPLAISLPILLALGGMFYAVLNYVFPVFMVADELLAPFPPDGVAKAREIAFARCRLTNSLLAFACVSLFVAMLLPAGLILVKRVRQQARRHLLPVAVGSACVSCLGVLMAHIVMEFTTTANLGITRTFIAHWLMFGFFGSGIGMAVGIAFGDRKLAMLAWQRCLVAGLISATIFDLSSVVLPRIRLDTLIPGGVLWGSREPWLIAMWVAFLLLPLAIGLRKLTERPRKKKGQ